MTQASIWKRNTSLVVALFGALALGACTTTGTPSVAPSELVQGGNRAADSAAPLNTPQVASTAPAAPIEPSFIPTSDDLIGVDAVSAETMLGRPALKRADRGSEMWQYPSDDCVLFVFLYPNEAGDMAVNYLTASAAERGAPVPEDDVCIASAVRAAANAPAMS